ncbi:Methyltransferase domain-containing protein [Tessaracoccus bendigoensis DSM 12906]|uniref:site-specific DNA-methyltransferase (adenine-specific) n=1 Tax=Tessaracoccus bendigoensis DSM 12906 TaxID=1123357 RepID=A0A1M5ZZE1_9ACTN|nr:BREX-1 system adenine-specific DNA-methyltransferase PglX [Tessaracoccus bendigoensis]SHI29548.1 Methyltransferase domain-containing protein [Tessaracoccus bendigoensis DSM 12906]
METAPLKSFATWARKELIREVGARIAVVLAPASPERVEQPRSVEALEKAVMVGGGGDVGRAAVADKVAYTWFNRIIALRFMDANGYTGVGVVSPHAGVQTGQPEILAEAKRGNIDSGVVGVKARDVVAGLLNGTRRSADAQGEAYALLLADYCRFWNRAMPFMFEREGDFTELLIPANLLADDSVASRAVKVLTRDVCQDVEVIGWLYQFYISERKDEVFDGFKKSKKAGADEIPAATQLFTPHWIVRYVVENSLGRLWMLNRPASRLVDLMAYYITPLDQDADFVKIGGPEELRIADPACGSGHMLTYAFDLLYAIYEEEGYAPAEIPGLILTNNLYGVEIDPRAGALAAFALSMKARAKQRTFFSKQIEPNVCVLDPISFSPAEIDFLVTRAGDRHAEAAFWNQFLHADTVGSLIQPDPVLTARLGQHMTQLDDNGDILLAETLDWAQRVIEQAKYLAQPCHVVVANPPYMGSKNMAGLLASVLRSEYIGFHSDLFAAFIARIRSLLLPGGQFGIMSPNTWLYISSHASIRQLLSTKGTRLGGLVELPLSGFKGATVQICAFFGAASKGAGPSHFVRLVREPGDEEGLARLVRESSRMACDSEYVFIRELSRFSNLPNGAFAYWLSAEMLGAFERGTRLEYVAEPRQGMATADNGRFLRLWSEVGQERFGVDLSREEAALSGKRWFPHNKGGDYRKWAGNQEWVVDWENDGAELFAERPKAVIRSPQLYFQPSVSWSKIGTGMPAFRYFPKGFLFDSAGLSIFGGERELLRLMAVCNSTVARDMLAATAPTLNFEVGTLAQLPVVEVSEAARVLAAELIRVHQDDWDGRETAWGFSRPRTIECPGSSLAERLQRELAESNLLVARVRSMEEQLNAEVAAAYGLAQTFDPIVPTSRVTLSVNPEFTYGPGKSESEYRALWMASRVGDLVSYAVACMFGRYSLDEPGLILADQGATVRDYLAKVPSPTFAPDKDNVLPILDGDWFEDDIVARFRNFLRVVFGEQHFEENLRFVTESLGVKDMRDYFVRSFYKDHVQRYKKRPIYWLFSSPKGSFNALIYMHRYTPSTVSTVLNEYLREFAAKLTSSLHQQERLAAGGGTPRQQAAAQKEADRLRKVLLELEEYEHDVLYPLASRQLAIDLDDGVKANYPKFGAALKKIPGLEASDE